MIAFAFASIWVPYERIVVTTAGSPVGMAEIANAIAAVKTVSKLSPRDRLRMIEIGDGGAADEEDLARQLLQLDRERGVDLLRALWSMSEMWPTSVAIPVEVTTKLPAPRVTFVFMKTMSVRSPSGVSVEVDRLDAFRDRQALAGQGRLGDLERRRREQPAVGRDDVACLDRDDVARNELLRPEAATSSPSRRTRALTIIIFCSAATASAAFPSWRRPRTALNSVRKSSTSPVPSSLSG